MTRGSAEVYLSLFFCNRLLGCFEKNKKSSLQNHYFSEIIFHHFSLIFADLIDYIFNFQSFPFANLSQIIVKLNFEKNYGVLGIGTLG